MKLHQIRNATLLLTLGAHRLLVDPMLCDPGAIPGLKMFGGGRRPNPLVPLPAHTSDLLDAATGLLVTHEHPDHFDPPALAWAKRRELPVWTNGADLKNLRRRGADARLVEDGVMGMRAEVIPATHGRGVLGWLMGPGAGYYLARPGEPSVYLTGDTIMTDTVRAAIRRLKPDVIVAPAGAANFGIGPDILFGQDELMELARLAAEVGGAVVFNHLEALDHCPTTRAGLRAKLDAEGLAAHIPEDGEELVFTLPVAETQRAQAPELHAAHMRPDLQKWVTARFNGA